MRRVLSLVNMCLIGMYAGSASATVTVAFSGTDSLVAHGAVRVSNDTFSAGFYDSAPLLAPFVSPLPGSLRHAEHPAIGLGVNIDVNYLMLDGIGGYQLTPNGSTTLFSFGSLDNFTGMRLTPGARLPAAAEVGILPSAIDLPSGMIIPSGARSTRTLRDWRLIRMILQATGTIRRLTSSTER